MTRLFQVMAGARYGGAEAFFTRLAVALERSGQVQRVAIRRDPARAAALAAGGIEAVQLGFGGRLDMTTRPALARIIRDWRPGLALTWMSRATSLMPAGLCPIVARLGGYYDLKYYRRADHLIGNTEAIVRYIVDSGWPEARVHYLPNFVAPPAAATVPRSALGVPAYAKLAVALGRLHPNKGFDVLLEAMALLPAVHLVIAGEGPERWALERRIAALGLGSRVALPGWRDDAASLIATADVVVLPSRLEPLGNVVIEAWAQRVPIVAAAADGPRGLIRHGETGVLVEIEAADALADGIRDVLAGRYPEMAEAGYEAYLSHFTAQAVVAAYRDLFARIAG